MSEKNNLIVNYAVEDPLILEYVWVDGENKLRSKIMITTDNILPSLWTYDGSSTKQASGSRSDILLMPVAIFNNPFYKQRAQFVLCETYVHDYENNIDTPHPTNTRAICRKILDKAKDYEPQFGMEQEYVLYDRLNKPYKWLADDNPGIGGQGPYYCGVGGDRAFGRNIVDEHMDLCLKAGVKICGTNAEVLASQWEYQIGICDGIKMGDHLLMARYIMDRVVEKYELYVSIEPKPIDGDWNGSGCHANFSTKQMRENNGLEYILEAQKKLEKTHSEHMKYYGLNNEKRMTGKHETSSYYKYSTGEFNGIGDRSASVRIPLHVYKNKKGYLEDRRPGGNCDPYLVIAKLVETVCL